MNSRKRECKTQECCQPKDKMEIAQEGIRNGPEIKMRNTFVNQTTLIKHKSSLSCIESTNNIKIKMKLATEL